LERTSRGLDSRELDLTLKGVETREKVDMNSEEVETRGEVYLILKGA